MRLRSAGQGPRRECTPSSGRRQRREVAARIGPLRAGQRNPVPLPGALRTTERVGLQRLRVQRLERLRNPVGPADDAGAVHRHRRISHTREHRDDARLRRSRAVLCAAARSGRGTFPSPAGTHRTRSPCTARASARASPCPARNARPIRRGTFDNGSRGSRSPMHRVSTSRGDYTTAATPRGIRPRPPPTSLTPRAGLWLRPS